MKTSPTHDLTEHAVAGQLGRRWTALTVDSLTRSSADTNREGYEACRIGHWLLVVGDWLLSSATACRSKIANCQRPITNHQFLTFALLIVTSLALGGCGSNKNSTPTVKPRELPTYAGRLSLVQFSPDGKQLAAGGVNGEVLVWRGTDDRPTKLESGHKSPLVSLTWSPDGLLCVTDLDRGFVGWQFGKAEPVRVEFPQLAAAAVCVAFRPMTTERELVLGMRDGSLLFVDKTGSKQLKPEHRGPVKQILYSLDGKWLVSAGSDGQLLWRDAGTRQVKQKVVGAETDISRLLLSGDGQQLISGDWSGRLKVWDMNTRKMLREFEQPDAVSGLGWVRGELVSGSWDGTLRGWDVSSGRCVRSVVTGQPMHDLTADSASSRVATVSLDRSVRVWDWQSAPSP